MATRRLRLEIGGVAAVAELCDDLSPKMAEAFWASLPIETVLSHGKWSGSACFFQPADGPMQAVTALEHPVCSIYPGMLVVRPGGSEVLMSYGQAEYRWAIGTDYTTPVAKIVENREALLKALARMHDEGDKVIVIRHHG